MLYGRARDAGLQAGVAFRKEFLSGLTDLPETSISRSESIEQMKLLQYGITLKSVALDEAVPGHV